MEIRRFFPEDAGEVSALIATALRITNLHDYPLAFIEEEIAALQPANILERAGWTHFYVACDTGGGPAPCPPGGAPQKGKLIGCGAIGPYWGRQDESSLFTIFVLPDCQGKGVGRQIVQTLERDEYFLRAKRVEVPASITGVPFYLKMGYRYKDGAGGQDAEGLVRMEKLRRL